MRGANFPVRMSPTLCIAVHPHMRGANGKIVCDALNKVAVHPHMRGANARCGPCGRRFARFIPTCVGQMMTHPMDEDGKWRFIPTCVGQIYICLGRKPFPAGSSPHAWGKCGYSLGVEPSERFIPTCVGQIQTTPEASSGECGSSPHAWGKFPALRKSVCLIPVHPHMRGANARIARAVVSCRRFIPTCVGQICGKGRRRRRKRRFIPTCVGQIYKNLVVFAVVTGSSPHAWGRFRDATISLGCKPVHPHMRGADGPAQRCPRQFAAVHPHMRGADDTRITGEVLERGSSHMRGAD